jgi:hypothetical protein
MTRPRVGAQGLLLWRVAANILDKPLGQTERGGSPAEGLGVRLISRLK